MRLIPDLLSPLDFNIAERSACTLDGEMSAVGNFHIVSDLPDDFLLRARIVGLPMDRRCITASWSAAWVHGAIPFPPLQHTVALRDGLRLRFDPAKRYTITQMSFFAGDVMGSPGAFVTTPLRTAIDLARFSTGEPRLSTTLNQLVGLAQTDMASVSEVLERANHLPYKQRAYRRMASALAFADTINVVDGVNPSHAVQESIKMHSVTHLKDKPAQGETFV